jgi:hypothetical protein
MRALWVVAIAIAPCVALAQVEPEMKDYSSVLLALDLPAPVLVKPALLLENAPKGFSAPLLMQSEPTPEVSGTVVSTPSAVYDKYPKKAFQLSLYTTLASFGVSLLANGTNFIVFGAQNRGLAVLSFVGSLGVLVGPSVGHFYARDYGVGTKQFLLRFFVPFGIALVGVVLVVVGFDNVAAVAVGTGIILGASAVSIFLTVRHIIDARNAPGRAAAQRGMTVSAAPMPIYRNDTQEKGLGLMLVTRF